MNNKASVLILGFIVATMLMALGGAVFVRSASENRLIQRNLETTQSFWLAEAAANQALYSLRSNYALTSVSSTTSLGGKGGYRADITANPDGSRTVTAYGFIPASGTARAQRSIEVVMNKLIPPGFYDNAIYCAGEVELSGNAFSVTNNTPAPDDKAIIYADELETNQLDNITGTTTHDATISPLARLDFQQLYDLALAQGNVYSAARLANIKNGTDHFPASFYYSPGVPNINYIQSDLELNGNIGTIGGFFVVVGDVLTNPNATYEMEINGNGQIDGVIYTRGEFEVNGGGGGLNVSGGVWAGEEAELHGNAHIAYNQEYMDSLQSLGLNPGVQVISWKDLQNPYKLQ